MRVASESTNFNFLFLLFTFLKNYDNLQYMAKTVIEVSKKWEMKITQSVLRRFSRKIKESNIIQKVKGSRYNKRKESKLKIKKVL